MTELKVGEKVLVEATITFVWPSGKIELSFDEPNTVGERVRINKQKICGSNDCSKHDSTNAIGIAAT